MGLLLNNQDTAFFVRELTRKLGMQINGVRNELDNLLQAGLVIETDSPTGTQVDDRAAGQKKYYKLNAQSMLYPEMRALFLKARMVTEKDFVRRLAETGSVTYLALTGFFCGADDAPTDIFIVGRVNKERMLSQIKAFEKEIGREINYTLMTPQEYKYRRDVTDKFLYSILESKKIVVVDSADEVVPAV